MKKFLKYFLRTVLLLFILFNIAAIFYAYKFTHFYDAGNTILKKQYEKTSWEKIRDALSGRNSFKLKILLFPTQLLKSFI
jgi:hypothetical protein